MADTPIIMNEQQFQRIKTVLTRLYHETAARMVFLVDRDGQPIASHGEVSEFDATSFASLAAGNVAATSSMARLIGEQSFPTLSHEGERDSIYIYVVGRSLLCVIFDERSTLGLVKLRVKRVYPELMAIMEDMTKTAAENRAREEAFFSEITDEDIDSLFS
jgi:predicted regulator of Ras-like GTPase activity (Roadblock/LC7/MglB family)